MNPTKLTLLSLMMLIVMSVGVWGADCDGTCIIGNKTDELLVGYINETNTTSISSSVNWYNNNVLIYTEKNSQMLYCNFNTGFNCSLPIAEIGSEVSFIDDGKYGQALNFTGVSPNNYIVIDDDDILTTTTGNLTLFAWFRLNTVEPQNTMQLIAKHSTSDNGNQEYALGISSTKGIDFWWSNETNAGRLGLSSNLFNDTEWHFVVVTFNNETKNLTMYFDNLLKTNTNYPYINLGRNTIKNLNFGTYSNKGTSSVHQLNGSLDEVGIYDKVFNINEIRYLYDYGIEQRKNMVFLNASYYNTYDNIINEHFISTGGTPISQNSSNVYISPYNVSFFITTNFLNKNNIKLAMNNGNWIRNNVNGFFTPYLTNFVDTMPVPIRWEAYNPSLDSDTLNPLNCSDFSYDFSKIDYYLDRVQNVFNASPLITYWRVPNCFWTDPSTYHINVTYTFQDVANHFDTITEHIYQVCTNGSINCKDFSTFQFYLFDEHCSGSNAAYWCGNDGELYNISILLNLIRPKLEQRFPTAKHYIINGGQTLNTKILKIINETDDFYGYSAQYYVYGTNRDYYTLRKNYNLSRTLYDTQKEWIINNVNRTVPYFTGHFSMVDSLRYNFGTSFALSNESAPLLALTYMDYILNGDIYALKYWQTFSSTQESLFGSGANNVTPNRNYYILKNMYNLFYEADIYDSYTDDKYFYTLYGKKNNKNNIMIINARKAISYINISDYNNGNYYGLVNENLFKINDSELFLNDMDTLFLYEYDNNDYQYYVLNSGGSINFRNVSNILINNDSVNIFCSTNNQTYTIGSGEQWQFDGCSAGACATQDCSFPIDGLSTTSTLYRGLYPNIANITEGTDNTTYQIDDDVNMTFTINDSKILYYYHLGYLSWLGSGQKVLTVTNTTVNATLSGLNSVHHTNAEPGKAAGTPNFIDHTGTIEKTIASGERMFILNYATGQPRITFLSSTITDIDWELGSAYLEVVYAGTGTISTNNMTYLAGEGGYYDTYYNGADTGYIYKTPTFDMETAGTWLFSASVYSYQACKDIGDSFSEQFSEIFIAMALVVVIVVAGFVYGKIEGKGEVKVEGLTKMMVAIALTLIIAVVVSLVIILVTTTGAC